MDVLHTTCALWDHVHGAPSAALTGDWVHTSTKVARDVHAAPHACKNVPLGLLKAGVLLAALGHDAGHPGVTSAHLHAVQHKLCSRYSTGPVLEQHHVQRAWECVHGCVRRKTAPLHALSSTHTWQLYGVMQACILGTDMAQHSLLLEELRSAQDGTRAASTLSRTQSAYADSAVWQSVLGEPQLPPAQGNALCRGTLAGSFYGTPLQHGGGSTLDVTAAGQEAGPASGRAQSGAAHSPSGSVSSGFSSVLSVTANTALEAASPSASPPRPAPVKTLGGVRVPYTFKRTPMHRVSGAACSTPRATSPVATAAAPVATAAPSPAGTPVLPMMAQGVSVTAVQQRDTNGNSAAPRKKAAGARPAGRHLFMKQRSTPLLEGHARNTPASSATGKPLLLGVRGSAVRMNTDAARVQHAEQAKQRTRAPFARISDAACTSGQVHAACGEAASLAPAAAQRARRPRAYSLPARSMPQQCCAAALDTPQVRLWVCLVHAADIGAQTRPLQVAAAWGDAVLDEFQEQVRQERDEGRAVTAFMDTCTLLSRVQCQLGFMRAVVQPLWSTVAACLHLPPAPIAQLQRNVQCTTALRDELIARGHACSGRLHDALCSVAVPSGGTEEQCSPAHSRAPPQHMGPRKRSRHSSSAADVGAAAVLCSARSGAVGVPATSRCGTWE